MMIEDRSTVRLKRKTAQRYSVLWSQSDPGQAPEGYHYDRLSRFLPAGHLRGWVLDAGCGDGIDTLRMAQRCHGSVVSVDLSPGGVALTKRRTQHLTNVQVLRADVERLPLASGQFDFVYSYGVLHHVPHPERGLFELVRVLKPGGLLALYLYEDFEQRSGFERALLWMVTLFRLATVQLPPRLLYRVCQVGSPIVYVCLTLPARLLARLGLTAVSRRIPYHHGTGPFRLAGDLYDRFAAPIEKRYSRSQIERWLRRADLESVAVAPMRGWVATGRKPKPECIRGRGS